MATIGSLIDAMKTVAVKRAAIAAEDKLLKARQDELQEEIIAAMDKQDTRVGEGKIAKASIVTSDEPTTEDWEQFLTWAKRTGNLHLIQHRISSPAWREVKAKKGSDVPGIGTFVKRSLLLRAV